MSRFKDSWGKAKIMLSQLLCIGAVFTACTDDEVFNQTTKALQVSVSTESPSESRAIIDGGYLPDGASIGVTLTAEDGSAYDGQAFTNLQYTAAGEGSAQTWSSATPASLSITTGKVIAYYPYYGGDDFDLKAVPVETASQTDYMYAKPVTGINMVSPAANLTMQHAMTDIRINVKKGTYTGTGEVTKITAKAPAFATTATMDAETGVFANVSGGGAQFVQELTGAAISSGNVVHDFLIVPDAKSASGEVSIFVIIDGKKFAVTVPYNESFQQGFAYTYNLTLDNAALTLDGVSVAKWGVKAEVDESLQFYDDQYIVEIQVPNDNYEFIHNISNFVGTIDWGDGTTTEYITSTSAPSHIYTIAGDYTITSVGTMYGLNSHSIYDATNRKYRYPSKIITKLVRIGEVTGVSNMQYAFEDQSLLSVIVSGAFKGCTKVTNFQDAFNKCSKLQTIPGKLFENCIKATDFHNAFKSCTSLTSIPEGLFDKCTEVTNFSQTFSGTGITEIPAGLFDKCTEVTDFSMTFNGCTGLTEIPVGLFNHNTKVTDFQQTFYGCAGITEIPEGLFDYCTKVKNFAYTFGSCSNLQAIPEGLFDNNKLSMSFYYSFARCESLTNIPEGLFDECTEVTNFANMFEGCTGLQSIPSGLFDKCTKVTTFSGTFAECINLANIPEGLFDYNTEVMNFNKTFAKCENLQTIPKGLFDNNTKVTSFESTFKECYTIQNIPEGLFDKCTEVTSFGGTFAYTAITEIPEGLFDNNTKVIRFYNELYNKQGCFYNCTKLTNIPEGLFDNCTKVTSFENTFYRCLSLVSIPEGLFDYNTEVTDFHYTFGYCSSLQTIPEGLFDKCTEVTNFGGTFHGCSKLISIPEKLFRYNTEITDFAQTFEGCTNLTEIPEGLFDNNTKVTNFNSTFSECRSLKTIPVGLFDKCTKVTSFYNTFHYCSQLNGESLYTIINIDGVDTKVHLYERANYPEHFTAPTSYYGCFYSCTGLTDYSSIPSSWK